MNFHQYEEEKFSRTKYYMEKAQVELTYMGLVIGFFNLRFELSSRMAFDR